MHGKKLRIAHGQRRAAVKGEEVPGRNADFFKVLSAGGGRSKLMRSQVELFQRAFVQMVHVVMGDDEKIGEQAVRVDGRRRDARMSARLLTAVRKIRVQNHGAAAAADAEAALSQPCKFHDTDASLWITQSHFLSV